MSNDVYVVINGQEYVLEAGAMRPVESGYQRQVLESLVEIRAQLGHVETRLSNLETRVAAMEYWGGIAFGALAAIIAFVGMLAPRFWSHAGHEGV